LTSQTFMLSFSHNGTYVTSSNINRFFKTNDGVDAKKLSIMIDFFKKKFHLSRSSLFPSLLFHFSLFCPHINSSLFWCFVFLPRRITACTPSPPSSLPRHQFIEGKPFLPISFLFSDPPTKPGSPRRRRQSDRKLSL
jgi:hypothetical protein